MNNKRHRECYMYRHRHRYRDKRAMLEGQQLCSKDPHQAWWRDHQWVHLACKAWRIQRLTYQTQNWWRDRSLSSLEGWTLQFASLSLCGYRCRGGIELHRTGWKGEIFERVRGEWEKEAYWGERWKPPRNEVQPDCAFSMMIGDDYNKAHHRTVSLTIVAVDFVLRHSSAPIS